MDSVLAWSFIIAVALATAARIWLARRQIRHVRDHRHEVPREFAEAVPLASHQTAADYCVARTRLGIIDIVIGAVAVLALTVGGGVQRLSTSLGAVFDAAGLWHGVALVVSVIVLLSLLELPVAAWRTFVIEARFGFNRQTPALFLADLARQAAVGALLGIPLLAAVLWLMARMGPTWWLYVWMTWVGFNLLVLAIYPSVIAPLFNQFTPLSDTALAARINGLLARCGFRASGLFVMDGSKRSSHGNAYFTGFGAAKRIVFFDTLLARLTPAEIEAVLAHELGHFRRRHVWKRVALMFAASLALLWMLGQLVDQPSFYAGLGVSTPSTAAALVLFFLVVPVFAFYLQPLMSLLSRAHEFEADAYAAAHASAPDLIRALVRLYRDNAATLTPDPLYSAFYDSHPPAATRIARLQEVAG